MTNPIAPQDVAAEVRQVQNPEVLRTLALRTLGQIRELKGEKKNLAESKQSIADNDTQLQAAVERAEEFLTKVKEHKARIKALPETQNITAKEKDVAKELKNLGETLTHHLINYTKATGSNVIEDENGKELKIKHKVSVSSGQMKLF